MVFGVHARTQLFVLHPGHTAFWQLPNLGYNRHVVIGTIVMYVVTYTDTWKTTFFV